MGDRLNVEKFIKRFVGGSEDIIDKFSNGYCYWFSVLLKNRFPEDEIYYNSLNHFVFKYENKLYDITGDCTEKWNNKYLYNWNDYIQLEKGSSHLKGLIKNTILKENTYE